MADEEPKAVAADPEPAGPVGAGTAGADPAGTEPAGGAGGEASGRGQGGDGDGDGDGSDLDLFRPRTPVDNRWFDDEAGPVVRLYSMTRGRARPVEDGLFDLISLIVAKDPAPVAAAVPAHVLDPEHQTILAWCRREPISVAELGSYTDLPVSVVRVLLGDLYDAELISVTRPVPLAELPDERLLRDVINGLRAL
ncbi:DUF742 domain-containing protein [Kitasatospora sp. NPDC089913]|uniref:DUF742 domain-containing protein n=1 Tax=Kitasatospora sp. NPDC089913 TaxID=3364080 RepID=UPI00380A59E5